MKIETKEKDVWYCPLYNKIIPEGLCLDINYQRLKFFKRDALKDLIKRKQVTITKINNTCQKCPNMPL